MADLLIQAGADQELLDHWTEVGIKRAQRRPTYST
jgi:hypothetical protein